ncbi:hypothetical protein GCM10022381_15250 [Leifsonia kafniensis]|uniref:Uncharacterized protein n=1 Tax=Leifsonia kafniensis TaxID=475957 RepID=A0ABP7KEF1_9MICO
MADNPGTPPAGSEPAEPQPTTPPADHRPRPKYGELAPEGWTWSPPPGANPHSTVVPDGAQQPVNSAASSSTSSLNSARQSRQAPAPQPPYLGAAATKKHGSTPAWDRPVTLGLLVLGLLGLFSALAILGSVPDAIQMLYTQENLGTYSPAAGVDSLILAGKLTQGAIWVVTAALSVFVMSRRRRAFYLPLIGGVVSIIAIFVFLSVILATDSTLLDFYGQQ